MKYRVLIQPSAEADAEEAYLYILQKDSPNHAARWFNGLLDAFLSLEDMPHRCKVAPENSAFEREIRQLLYGPYRILFTVREDQVHVLHVRHGARRHLEP